MTSRSTAGHGRIATCGRFGNALFDAVLIAIALICTLYFIDIGRSEADGPDVAVVEGGKESSGLALQRSLERKLKRHCNEFRSDLHVWERYLDNRAKRKLKEIASACAEHENGGQ